MTETRERLLADLAGSRAFARLPGPELERLVRSARHARFLQGSLLLQEGQENARLFFLLKGSVSVYSGGKLVSRYGRAGDLFGEMSVVSEAPASATVVANEDLEALVLDPDVLEALRTASDGEAAAVYYQLFACSLLEKLRLTTLKARLADDAIRRWPLRTPAGGLGDGESEGDVVAKHLGDVLLVSQAVHTTDRAIAVTDADGRITRINLAAESLFACAEIDLAGRGIDSLCASEVGVALVGRLVSGEVSSWHGALELRKWDGEMFPAKVSLTAVLDPEGQRIGLLVVIDDQTEQAALRSRLEHSQKLEVAGRMAGGIAHDLNNLLQPIIGYAHLVMESAPPESQLQRYMETVLRASERARDMVAQFLAYAGPPRMAPVPLPVAPLLQDCAQLIQSNWSSAVQVRLQLPGEPLAVRADPTQTHRVLLNLATNAAHAMPDGGTLTFTAEAVTLTDWADHFGRVLHGPYVRLGVADTGVGMSADLLDKIWDPFFTTRKPGEGLGLGLAMLRSIVEHHGGGLEVHSAPGAGSAFAVYLPIAEPVAERVEAPRPDRPEGAGRILFVDDEEMVCGLAKTVLERAGYRVTALTTPRDALELFRATPAQYDLVITDLAMPDMRGDELAREVRAERAQVPIILCTGSLRADPAELGRSRLFDQVIYKPVAPNQLCVEVRRTLARGAAPG